MPPRGRRPAGAGKTWQDHYTRRAKQEHYPARSVYKLQEIQRKFRLIRPAGRVLDLGCAPGSWLLYAAGLVGPAGSVVGVDLQPVTVALPAQVRVVQADVTAVDDWQRVAAGRFDVVLSDMAPATTGNRVVDAARSLALCEAALEAARQVLAPGGGFVCKIFQGEDFKAFEAGLRREFDTTKNFKPRSSRKASREIFMIALGRRGAAETEDNQGRN